MNNESRENATTDSPGFTTTPNEALQNSQKEWFEFSELFPHELVGLHEDHRLYEGDLYILSNVTRIGNKAFCGCYHVRHVVLPDGLKSIGESAFLKSPVKAYGATFVAAVLTDSCFFVLKLGDGNACLLTRDLHAQLLNHLFPQLEDDELQFNLTTSLCNSDADVAFKHCFCRLKDRRDVQGLILTTDGIINSYQSEQAYLGFIENIFAGYREQQRKDAHADLAEFLPRLSEKGSGDDLSVAIICRKK